MSAGAPAGSAYLSIGEVLHRLRPQFPDITISKIRFLEAEGLLEPERSPAGYRQFSADDVERLRFILECQRDRYLPLRVIREHLVAVDRGEEPAGGRAWPTGPTGPTEPPHRPEHAERAGRPEREPRSTPEAFATDVSEIRLTRRELASAAGLRPDQLEDLERYGLVATRSGGSHFDGDALLVARTVAALGSYGLEPRHLRAFKTAADREVGLIEQVVSPYARARDGEARDHAVSVVRELAALSVRLHTALVRAGLSAELLR